MLHESTVHSHESDLGSQLEPGPGLESVSGPPEPVSGLPELEPGPGPGPGPGREQRRYIQTSVSVGASEGRGWVGLD